MIKIKYIFLVLVLLSLLVAYSCSLGDFSSHSPVTTPATIQITTQTIAPTTKTSQITGQTTTTTTTTPPILSFPIEGEEGDWVRLGGIGIWVDTIEVKSNKNYMFPRDNYSLYLNVKLSNRTETLFTISPWVFELLLQDGEKITFDFIMEKDEPKKREFGFVELEPKHYTQGELRFIIENPDEGAALLLYSNNLRDKLLFKINLKEMTP